jgi:adenosyl cobinamide kinase/adenosyl cobinamide phosphate guanylyltransferase
MNLVLVTGGVRAGKSSWAEAEAARLGGERVAFIATAEPNDAEMAERIEAHRASRPPSWITLEAPLEVSAALLAAEPSVVVLDCLTLWVANLLLAPGGDAASTLSHVEALLDAASTREGTLIVVTNEVGLGVVPDNELARTYRDLLGSANARVAQAAERVLLLVSGIPLDLK